MLGRIANTRRTIPTWTITWVQAGSVTLVLDLFPQVHFFFWGAFSARDPGWAHYSVYGLLMMFLDVFGFESNTGTVFQLLDSPLTALTGIRLRSRPENMFAFIPTPALPTFLITEWVASHQWRECLLAMSGGDTILRRQSNHFSMFPNKFCAAKNSSLQYKNPYKD
jgi:hypothetical protein